MNLYIVCIRKDTGHMLSFGIVAASRTLAETKAKQLAGVPDTTEPHTSQLLHAVDAVVS